MLTEIVIELLQLLIVMSGSPLLVGVIRKAKARLERMLAKAGEEKK